MLPRTRGAAKDKVKSDTRKMDKLIESLVEDATGETDMDLRDKLAIFDRAAKWHLIKHRTAENSGAELDGLIDGDDAEDGTDE